MTEGYLAWIMLGASIALMIIGCPIGIGLASIGIIFGIIGWGGMGLISAFPERLFTTMTTFELAAITLFIFMGVFLEHSGVSEMLFESLRLMFAGIRGGLLISTMILATVFAACTGIVGASVVTIGLIALPTMFKYNYDKSLAMGTVCAGGGLGVIIPPSIMLVLYGPAAGLSVADLFMAAIVPGLVLSGCYLVYIGIRCALNPQLGPPISLEERSQVSIKKAILPFLRAFLPTALLIIGVLGSILFGFASPTEAAGVGAFLSIIICIYYGRFNMKSLNESLFETIKICSMIMLIVVGAGFFTSVFLGIGGGKLIEYHLLKIQVYPEILLVVMLSIIGVLGCFMDWIAILYITIPIFRPMILQVGWDPLWFAILACITLQLSYITPPFAYSVFYMKGIVPAEIKIEDIYRGCIPFIPLQILTLIIIYLFPWLVLWLPNIGR